MLLRNIAGTCRANDVSLKHTGIVYMRKGEGVVRQGLHPCTCFESQGNVNFKAGYPWVGGAVWACRTRRESIPGGS